MLYPLKFKPIVLDKIWGFESWQLSGYGDYVSEVANGFLQDNPLDELIEVYMDELVGGKTYDRFGCLFPLLFKFIHAKDQLSVQVHPNDDQAASQDQLGKTEMWYVMQADKDASLVLGFNRATSPQEIRSHLQSQTLEQILQIVPAKVGDVAYIPAGLVHALRSGTMVAEVQQTSDLTYRLYDYNRRDQSGNLRPLHIEEALAVADCGRHATPLVDYSLPHNGVANLVRDVHFVTNIMCFDKPVARDYSPLDSFVVYMAVEGSAVIQSPEPEIEDVKICAGETVLIPASLTDITLVPEGKAKLLEIYL